MNKLTPACKLLLFNLWHKYNYFSRKGMLGANGSFYYDDKRLSLEVGVGITTIGRIKKYLTQEGYIYIKNGINKGRATQYWMLRKPYRGGSFVDISKPTNLNAKDIIQPLKAHQNDPPNKVNNKDMNKEVSNNISKEELKNGIEGLIKLRGVIYAKDFYINKGYAEVEVGRVLSELGEQNR